MATSPSSYYSSDFESRLEEIYRLPKKYKLLDVLGQGGYGVVFKCLDLETKQIVAIKASQDRRSISDEASMLKVLMNNNLDQQNIIKFYDHSTNYLVLEVLDMSLKEYIQCRRAPMCMQDIRDAIQQLALAFDGLKNIGVIHTDLKTANIMLVDHLRRPFKVKLIDFGLAIFTSAAKNHMIHQTPFFRAPEIILGLPFSEAVDIWSLGCVMAIMVFGYALFPGRIDYILLQDMVDLIGLPPDHLIENGRKGRHYFKKTDSNQWVLKPAGEYFGPMQYFSEKKSYTFRCLDEVKMKEKCSEAAAAEWAECIELLKAMLKWDEKERITPSEILTHPFITMSYVSSSSGSSQLGSSSGSGESLESEATESSPSQAPETSITQPAERGTKKAAEPAVLVTLPSGLIMVQPAPPQNRITLDSSDSKSEDSNPVAAPATILEDTNNPDDTEDCEPKRKKKKNIVRRFFSWMKKTVCPCCRVGVADR